MVKTLTQEEAIQSQIEDSKKIEIWWENLRFDDKKNIYDYHKKIFKYRNCQHEHIRKIPYYDGEVTQCDDCGYHFVSKDFPIFERDEKLKNILKNEDK